MADKKTQFPGEKIRESARQALERHRQLLHDLESPLEAFLSETERLRQRATSLQKIGQQILLIAQEEDASGEELGGRVEQAQAISRDLDVEEQQLRNKIQIAGSEGVFFEMDIGTVKAFLTRVQAPIFRDAVESLDDVRREELGL